MKKLFCSLLCILLCSCSAAVEKEPEKNEVDEPVVEVREDSDVSFLAVGDNLIHGAVYGDLNCLNYDGAWDYSGIYEHTKDMIAAADIANINQETILGGRDMGLESYPSFNSPLEFADALASVGFDWVSQATNHCLDMGEIGIMTNLNYWNNYQDITVTGINRSEEERGKARIIEKNGMKIGCINYTYGTNGYIVPEGKGYLVNYIDQNQIHQDIEQLKQEKVDVIIASMHWGEEYNFGVTQQQKDLAQFLADEGVSVIIGSHPHVIEPAEYITASDGRQTLVYYSLGNFMSAQDVNYTMLGGMATFDLHLDGVSGEVSVGNAKFYPTVTHFDKGISHFKAYLLKDYTEDLASSHSLSATISRQYFANLATEVMKDTKNIEIVY